MKKDLIYEFSSSVDLVIKRYEQKNITSSLLYFSALFFSQKAFFCLAINPLDITHY